MPELIRSDTGALVAPADPALTRYLEERSRKMLEMSERAQLWDAINILKNRIEKLEKEQLNA